MLNKKTFTSAFFVALAALFLMPTVALASFPDFGPFETQTRYLEAGFGIAENFFREAAGLGGNQTLQYLCLTAALVGAAMVVMRKKNQALGILIPWLVLVFIMLAGPYNSKFLFLKATPQVAGNFTLPGGISHSDQKGFAPQILSIHVMSTLHRLFYDYFQSNNLNNIVDGIQARAAFGAIGNIQPGDNTYKLLNSARQCSSAGVNKADGSVQPTENASAVMTLRQGIDKIRQQGQNADIQDTLLGTPMLILPQSLSSLPIGAREGYIIGINELNSKLDLGYDELTVSSTSELPEIIQDIEAEFFDLGPGPDSLAHYIKAENSDPALHEGLKYRANRTGIAEYAYNSPLSLKSKELLGTIAQIPVFLEQVSIDSNGNAAVEDTRESCDNATKLAVNAFFQDALKSGNIDENFSNMLISKMNSGAIITKADVAPYMSMSNNTGIIAKMYVNDILSNGVANAETTANLYSRIINLGIRNYETQNKPQNGDKPDLDPSIGGPGSTVVNGVSQMFVGFAKPIVQLLSPFIMAFAVMVLEFMKIIIDMALMGIIIVTPIAFMMGLIIPSYALGVMTLMTLCVLVLKMVPVTFTITDAIFSIMYALLGAGLEDNGLTLSDIGTYLNPVNWVLAAANLVFDVPTFEQTLLMFAAAGVYTSLVGLSLFILFKIGDPSSVAQLASIDNAAKKLTTTAIALGGAAAVGTVGGAAALKGQLGRAAAGKKGAEMLNKGKEAGIKAAEELGSGASGEDKNNAFNKAFQEQAGFSLGEEVFDKLGQEKEGVLDKFGEEEAFKTASGGLEMGKGTKGLLSNMALTSLKEGGEVAAGAMSSMLPGGGGALMQQAGNAWTEGQARSEARVSARGEGKSLYSASQQAEVQKYRGQFSGMLGDAAAGDGLYGDGSAASSGMLSASMMGGSISDGQQQAGGITQGMWSSAAIASINGKSLSATDYAAAATASTLQAEANIHAAADAEIGGLNATSAQIQASAREAQLSQLKSFKTQQEKEEDILNHERLEQAYNDKSGVIESEMDQIIQIKEPIYEKDPSTGERLKDDFGNDIIAGYRATGHVEAVKEFEKSFKELHEGRGGIEEELLQQNANHELIKNRDKASVELHNASLKVAEEFNALEATSSTGKVIVENGKPLTVSQHLNKQKERLAKVNDDLSNNKIDVPTAEARSARLINEINRIEEKRSNYISENSDVMTAQSKLTAATSNFKQFMSDKVNAHMKETATNNLKRNMLGQDIELESKGGEAKFFKSQAAQSLRNFGVDMTSPNAAQTLAVESKKVLNRRYTSGTQFAAKTEAAKQFFQADYDEKYNPTKPGKEPSLSLAAHYEYSMIADSASGASNIKMESMVNRRMADQDWDSFNRAKAINIEAQLRGQAALGRSMNYSHRLKTSLDDNQQTAVRTQERAQEITFERKVSGPDANTGRIMTFGETLRQRAVQDKYKKLNIEIQKANGNAGAAIAGWKGKDFFGDVIAHDEPPGDFAAEFAKVYQSRGFDQDKAYQKQASLYDGMQKAANLARKLGLSKDKAIGRKEREDSHQISHFFSELNLKSIYSGCDHMGQEGKTIKAELESLVGDLKKANGFHIATNGSLYHEVGVSLREQQGKELKDRLKKDGLEDHAPKNRDDVEKRAKEASLSSLLDN